MVILTKVFIKLVSEVLGEGCADSGMSVMRCKKVRDINFNITKLALTYYFVDSSS